jgi:hypothetical protein
MPMLPLNGTRFSVCMVEIELNRLKLDPANPRLHRCARRILMAAQSYIPGRDQVLDRHLVVLKFDPLHHQAQYLLVCFKARMQERVFPFPRLNW